MQPGEERVCRVFIGVPFDTGGKTATPQYGGTEAFANCTTKLLHGRNTVRSWSKYRPILRNAKVPQRVFQPDESSKNHFNIIIPHMPTLTHCKRSPFFLPTNLFKSRICNLIVIKLVIL
jgi:hypothetical protein